MTNQALFWPQTETTCHHLLTWHLKTNCVKRRSNSRKVKTHGGYASARYPQKKKVKSMSDVLSRVKKIVVEHLDVEEDKVAENASFIDDLGADSLDNVELVMAFEEEFDIEIPDDAAEHIQKVGDAVKFISEHLNS